MLNYNEEILEEHKEIISKYVHETILDDIYVVRYYPEREYTFGYDFINIYFMSKFSALIFLMKHKDQCRPKS